jgi:prevent-host-death family protein
MDMTDKQVRSDEARRNLRTLLDEVARGYHITILRYDKEAAVLVPVDWYEDAEAAWGASLEKGDSHA